MENEPGRVVGLPEATARHFQQIVDGLPAIVALFTADGRIAYCNRQMLDYLDETLEQVRAQASAYNFHPDDRDGVLTLWATSIASGTAFDCEARLRRADGVYRWQRTRVFPLQGPEGQVDLWYGLCTDIDDTRRAEALLAGERQLFEMVALGRPAPVVLESLCRLLDATADGCMGGVLLFDTAATHVVQAIGPGLPGPFRHGLEGRKVSPESGPFGLAATSKTQVIVSDAASDARWAQDGWPALAATHGVNSCWSSPILAQTGEALGTFAIYRRDGGGPTAFHQELVQKLTHIASIAIEQTRAQDALRRSETRKAAIMDSALDCIVTIDHDGRITEFNPAAERTFGHPREAVIGSSLADVIIPPAMRRRHRRGLARHLSSGKARVLGKRIEMTAVRADGGEFPVELAITRIPLDGPPSFTGYLRDITESKRAEEELRTSEAYLAQAQRLSLTGSFTWNPTTDEHFWSQELYRLFEFDAGTELSLELILGRAHPLDMPLIQGVLELAEQGRDFDLECRFLTPPGGVKHMHVVAHRIGGPGDPVAYIGAVQDVTARRRAEEDLGKVRTELAHVARVTSLGALTASIAHEVNQPLSGIITNASTCLRMLAAEPPNVAGALETARRTIRDGNRAADVIARLRALFARQGGSTEAVDLNEAAKEVIALSWSELQRSRVLLRSELDDDLPPVAGDRVQLQQVILNLLLNAADAMSAVEDRPRRLTVRTWRADAEAVGLDVEDAGEGFDPDGAERLFEAFYSTKPAGMGIGLSVSRSIIEAHHGRLWARGNAGPGATFSFSLPEAAGGDVFARPAP